MKFRFLRTIRAHLLLLVLICILPALGMIIYTGLDQCYRETEEAKSDALQVVKHFSNTHECAIESARQFLMTLAKVPDIQNLNVTQSNKLLGELLKQNPLYSSLFVVNGRGFVHSSSHPMPSIPINVMQRKYFRDMVRTKDFSIGEYAVCPAVKRPVFHLAYPIIDTVGRFKGMVVISLDVAHYAQMFPMDKLPQGSSLSFSDHQGMSLYRYPSQEDNRIEGDLPDMVKAMSPQSEEGLFTYAKADGVKGLYAYKTFHIRKNEPPYLFIRVGIPEKKALSDARKVLALNVILLGFAFVIALISAWFLGDAISVNEDRPLRDSEENIIGIQSTIQDITEHKHAEEALRGSERGLRTIFESIQAGVLIIDPETHLIVDLNPAALKLIGAPKEKIVDSMCHMYVCPAEVGKCPITDLKQNVEDAERILLTPNGENRQIIKTVVPILIGGRRYLLESFVDITERKRAEEKLRESEERFRHLAENIREVFYIYEPDIHRLCYVSPAYQEIWGYPPSQHLYEKPGSLLDAVHPEDKDRVRRSLEKKSQGEVEEVYRIVRADGSIRWIKDRSFPIYDLLGKIRRIVGIAADVTNLKMGEEKLKYVSLHDSLTGLYNRIYFDEEINRIEKARYDSVGVVSCDVDGLKLVNDTLGHDQGDQLLVAAATVISESFRDGDLVARIGGDEFSAILPNTTETVVKNACQRIQAAVANHNANHPELPLSISIGFAVSNGVYRNIKDLFKDADDNMYMKKLYHTQNVRSTIVNTLIDTLKTKDLTTEKHVTRLEKLLVDMASIIGLPESATSDLSLLARFHDIGKVGVSDFILFKKGSLTSEEWIEVKRHCEIGYRIALSASGLIPVADWILKHHEWWNGQGYPLGIKGEEIPIECRLLAITEAYEAMTSIRPYRRAFSHGEAVTELLRHSGTQFDPELLEKFVQMLETYSDGLDTQSITAA